MERAGGTAIALREIAAGCGVARNSSDKGATDVQVKNVRIHKLTSYAARMWVAGGEPSGNPWKHSIPIPPCRDAH